MSVKLRDIEMIKLLLQNEAIPHSGSFYYLSPLGVIICYYGEGPNDYTIAELLLEHEADPDMKCKKNNETALMSVAEGNTEAGAQSVSLYGR